MGDEAEVPPVPAPVDEVVPVVHGGASEEMTVEHLLTHLLKDPRCDACTRGKMKEKYARRGAFKRDLSAWGDLLTCDHVHAWSSGTVGADGEKYAFVVRDVWSRFLMTYAVSKKNT